MAPEPEQFEVTLFGPGYGESMVLHLGMGDWAVVDSCVNKETGRPRTLEYLENIGVDAESAVRFIVATHWHDDHVRGLSAVVEACGSARFWLSAALRSDEFVQVVKARGERTLLSESGTVEMEKTIDVLRSRKAATGVSGLSYASEGTIVWQRPATPSVEVRAMTPSHSAIERGQRDIATLLPKRNRPRNAIPPLSPNHTGIALVLDLDGQQIVLGDDVEHSADETIGWAGVVNSELLPDVDARLVKVAHHGSENGHSPEFWANLADNEPVGLLAPFRRGRVNLPTEEGIVSLCQKTSALYATASLNAPPTRRRAGALGKEVKAATRWIRDALPESGRLTARRSVGSDEWAIETLAPAYQIC